MKTRIGAMFVAGSIALAAFAAPVSAAGKNDLSESCGVGAVVSSLTQAVGGIGKAAKALGINPGHALQDLHDIIPGCP